MTDCAPRKTRLSAGDPRAMPVHHQVQDFIALDPGTWETGWVRLVNGIPEEFGIQENLRVLDMVADRKLPVACEMVASYGMPVGAEVFDTCVWVGEFRHICRVRRINFQPVFRTDVKMHMCGAPRAKDANINQAIRDRFGDKGTKANPGLLFGMTTHAFAALGVAKRLNVGRSTIALRQIRRRVRESDLRMLVYSEG